jgi:hypothetical protein
VPWRIPFYVLEHDQHLVDKYLFFGSNLSWHKKRIMWNIRCQAAATACRLGRAKYSSVPQRE